MKSLQNRLEVANIVIAAADYLRRNRKKFHIHRTTSEDKRNYWQTHVTCTSSSEEDQEMADMTQESQLQRILRIRPATCDCPQV